MGMMLLSFTAWTQDSVVNNIAVDTPISTPVKKPIVKRQILAPQNDSLKKDTLVLAPPITFTNRDSIAATANSQGPYTALIYKSHPYFKFTDPGRYLATPKKWQGKEAIFYSIIGLLILFGLIKKGFYRYVQDLFQTYFQTSVKQRQLKEQLLQSPLPSLLLNIFFLLSIGMFVALLLPYFKLGNEINFWHLYLYAVAGLAVIYGVKFITLKLLGWVFQISETIESYIFIIFTTNKIIGILLIPFLIVLAFSFGSVNNAAITLSILLVVAVLIYRFFLSYTTVRRQMKLSFFHFFIYLCAFEIAPLLLINKLLFRFLG